MSAQLETERREYESQLELVTASLKEDPDNSELHNLKEELVQMIQLLDDALTELQPKASPPRPASKPAPKRQASPPPAEEQPKWSRENHPAFKKASASSSTTPAAAAPAAATPTAGDEPEQPVVYQVNDNVMAKWLSGDKGFYAARITSVTGSSTAPIYTVRFKSYDTVETLRGKDIRPVAAAKRKADAVSTAAPVVERGLEGGVVASAAADLYPQAAKLGEKEGDKEKPKFKKIKANKELEAGKNKWQEFNAKGKHGKTAKKDSMFRTPEGFKGRVGFTGSGQAMRKDPTRSRHVYQPNEDVD
ncbi:hypothetical protein B0T25DRAFT_251762 [Lasiosphaeria hispida]|uniref:Tudor domain-containing protein n=1 Tax=Lasiosphaeria hispida TaxID=260671 RepID=A0AAJ0HFM9_9PEZI|nr:hypothetical protein B0T25DRAFT_251762 [Lasiosphaeria hispida]